jgi:hypothetical protein
LRDHLHVQADAVALLHAQALQPVGELADLLVQFLVADLRIFAGRVAFPDDRGLIAARGEVPIEAVVADVRLAAANHLIEMSFLKS